VSNCPIKRLRLAPKAALSAISFRRIIRKVIADTVASTEQIDEELRDLFAALAQT
jgi:hypothetical protein